MRKYKAVLLDADGTLFDLDKAERYALKETLSLYNLPFDEKTLRIFRKIREKLEIRCEMGEISTNAMYTRRFFAFIDETKLPPEPMEFASLYSSVMERHIELCEGVYDTCKQLCEYASLYVVSNGQAAVQRARIAASSLISCLTGLFFSEEIGFPKPHKYFFDAVFMEMDDVKRQETLLVGHSLSADISGGKAAGLDTCWYNPKEKPNPDTNAPKYEIRKFNELLDFMEG